MRRGGQEVEGNLGEGSSCPDFVEGGCGRAGPGWTDQRIAEAYGCRVRTVENVRQRFVWDGFELALNGAKRQSPPTAPIGDGEGEAKVIATRLGNPPAGYGRWTLRLLASRVVELEIVESISHETVRQVLKKTV